MAIRFRTFTPNVLLSGGFFKECRYQSLTDVVTEASEWIECNKISVVNIETLVVSLSTINPPDPEFQGVYVSSESSTYAYQSVRVWYRE